MGFALPVAVRREIEPPPDWRSSIKHAGVRAVFKSRGITPDTDRYYKDTSLFACPGGP
jgi:hypothetical protein